MRRRQKTEKLITTIKKSGRLAIAFSGGVDSGFLMMTARDVLGDGAIAFTSVGLPHPQRETQTAVRLAESLGIEHHLVPTARMSQKKFTDNPRDRCYQCKKIMWTEMTRAAEKADISRLADGVCADDLDEHRPGLAAGKEMAVMSPLAEAGLTKREIRTLAEEAGLPNWDKPATPCLATRVPYGTRLTPQILTMVEQAEDHLVDLGFSRCRVRYHNGMARIEVPGDKLELFAAGTLRESIRTGLEHIGFTYVTVDLNGYVSGSMDTILENNQ